MATGKRSSRSKGGIFGIVLLLIALLVGGWFGFGRDLLDTGRDNPETTQTPVSGETVSFHFIDVGQGDATLIMTSAGCVLIDAGTNASESQLKAYLDSMKVTELAYAVFTHPHEDHIGGADMVLANYKVKKVILPEATATTKVYERMMDGIENSGAELIVPEPDYTFKVGEVSFRVLAPQGTGYKDINNYSIVLRADYGETSVLFTGDAEDVSEAEMLNAYGTTGALDVDLLKVGHHGSDSSTTEDFLRAVSPKWAVISLGSGNTYGHPKAVTLEKLNEYRVTYYRTDECGSIVFVTDGKTMYKENL